MAGQPFPTRVIKLDARGRIVEVHGWHFVDSHAAALDLAAKTAEALRSRLPRLVQNEQKGMFAVWFSTKESYIDSYLRDCRAEATAARYGSATPLLRRQMQDDNLATLIVKAGMVDGRHSVWVFVMTHDVAAIDQAERKGDRQSGARATLKVETD